MSYECIKVKPISPRIGAEISNLDLTQPLSKKQIDEVKKAFIEFGAIFFEIKRSAGTTKFVSPANLVPSESMWG